MSNCQKNSSGDFDFGTIFGSIVDVLSFVIMKSVELSFKGLAYLYDAHGDKVLSLMGLQVEKKRFLKIRKLELKHLQMGKKKFQVDDLGFGSVSRKMMKLSDLELTRHTIIAGASGAGKTSLMSLLQLEKIKSGHTVIFIDPKGDRKSMEEFRDLCHAHDRKVLIFSEFYQGPEWTALNPVKVGSVTQIADRLFHAFTWSEEHYANRCYSALVKTIGIIKKKNHTVELKEIRDELKRLPRDEFAPEEISGLVTRIDSIIDSDFGRSLTGGPGISELRSENVCLYIGLSVLGYAQMARGLGKIFIGDLNFTTYEALRNDPTKVPRMSVFIDELGAVIMDELIELLNKCRGAGIDLTMAFQSPFDTDKVSPELTKQILENTNNWFIMKQGIDESASFFSGAIGTMETIKDTKVVEDDVAQTRGSRREVESYLVHPNIIKRLKVGQAIYVEFMPLGLELLNLNRIDGGLPKRPLPPEQIQKQQIEQQKEEYEHLPL